MSIIDLIGVLAACATVITCFVIRASHGTDVEELKEEFETLCEQRARDEQVLSNMANVVTSNAKEFAVFRADVRTRMNLGPK